MKRDQAIQLASQGYEELELALKQGRSAALERYLSVMARFPTYSFHNSLLIYVQCPAATRVAGYRKWQSFGRQVKQGEQGIAIFAPMVYRRKHEADQHDGDTPLERYVAGFRVVHVFDVSQTDGDPLPEFAEVSGEPGSWLARLEEVAKCRGIALQYVRSLGGATGGCSAGRISIVEDLPPAEKFLTLVHELAHAALHSGQRRPATTEQVRETEAEAVGFVVSRAIGLECTTHSADYIRLYRGNVETLTESMQAIQRVSADLIRELQQNQPLGGTSLMHPPKNTVSSPRVAPPEMAA